MDTIYMNTNVLNNAQMDFLERELLMICVKNVLLLVKIVEIMKMTVDLAYLIYFCLSLSVLKIVLMDIIKVIQQLRMLVSNVNLIVYFA